MRTASRKNFTGEVRARCGCLGVVRDSASRISGQFPFVSVRITEPCTNRHPDWPQAGATVRFVPDDVKTCPTP